MILIFVKYFLLGFVVCSIGALPFGLVNLSVVNSSVNQNVKKSMEIAFGASIIELLYALGAVFTSSLLNEFIHDKIWVKMLVIAVLIISGIIFFTKKKTERKGSSRIYSRRFIKGILLNLVSIQVLLFWMLAVTYLSIRNYLPNSNFQVALFITGVWLAKINVLWFYAILGRKIAARSRLFSQNINRIIGVVLLVVAVFQIIQIQN